MTRYIHVFEDGTVKQSENLPTTTDFQEVENGVRQIFKVETDSDVTELDPFSYEWESLEHAKLEIVGGSECHC